MELETQAEDNDDECRPVDGFYQRGHPECEQCHFMAKATCKLIALRLGKGIEVIEGLLQQEHK